LVKVSSATLSLYMILFRRELYLDNNATTKPSPRVVKRVAEVLRNCYGNPSSLYKDARAAASELQDARETLAGTINAAPGELIFTGSASEALNTVLKTAFERFPAKRIVISAIEHSAVMNTTEYLRSRGAHIEICPVDQAGRIVKERFRELLGDDTSLACCMLANNEIGVLQDIPVLAEMAHNAGALFLCDCVQGLGKVTVDVRAMNTDYAVFSAHKIHGPKGVGALYVKEGRPLLPLIHGGHQEGGLRAGTEGTHNIAGFAEACRAVPELLAAAPRSKELKDRLLRGLLGLRPDIRVNSPAEHCLPNTLNITVPGVINSMLLGALDFYGISVSAGSACNTQENVPSHVLKAIGLTDEQARSAIRISLPETVSAGDIDYTLRVFTDFFSGRCSGVTMFTPAQLDEDLLLDPGVFILDVRFDGERRSIKGLPNSREVPFFRFVPALKKVPRDRSVIVVCQAGLNAPLVAFYMRQKGFPRVGFLAAGLAAWKMVHSDLYDKHCGRGVAAL